MPREMRFTGYAAQIRQECIENNRKCWWEKLNGKDRFRNLGISERIILKWNLKIYKIRCGLD
jgi:hypothetical protein